MMLSVSEDTDASTFAWSDLPEELLQLVLQRVPFPSLIRSREVCRKWNSLIISPQFTRKCQRQQKSKFVPVLVPSHLWENAEWGFHRYSSESNSWQPQSLSFLRAASEGGPLYLTASSGGLMCFKSEDRQNYIVCNPVTKRWRHLQLPVTYVQEFGPASSGEGPDYRHLVSDLVVDRETGNYKLVVASVLDEFKRTTLIYDSSTSVWRKGAQVPVDKWSVNPAVLTCNDKLYCLVKSIGNLEEGASVWTLLRYEVAQDIWSAAPVETGWPYNAMPDLELVEHLGQVLLVTRALTKRCLPNNVWYNTFSKVVESQDGPEMALLPERRLFHPADRSLGSTGYMTIVTSSFVGQGHLMYSTGVPFSSNDEIRVLKVLVLNTTDQNYTFLTDWMREGLHSKIRMEIRLLEPSLVAA